tara:strand:+ start:93 stop:935 length:843 start_codon:yes stop_codon:yes gene_type:complete
MNIKSAIIDGASILKRRFISSADLDSEILMAEAIKKKREFLILNSNFTIDKKDLKIFYKFIEKRSAREPIAYITNKKSFWSSEFFVTQDTLIPRPDTELIIENVLKFTKNKESLRILDIGIGSGCILLSILKEKKNFYGTGIDISKKCLKISKINAINLKVDHRLKLIKTDVDKLISSKYDLIVSNPPYIVKKKLKYLDRDVVKYEPTQALNGGIDGLSEIRKVINKSSELIKKKGKLILEIGFDQKNKVINLLNKEGFYINNTYKDLADNDRCIVCTKL